MAESVGGIYYDIEARTDGLIQGQRAVKSSTTAISADMQRIGVSAERMNTQVSASAKGVTTALSGIGRSAGQAGIQIQQFVGQIQGGVNPMVALSQQGADLGFVLGAPLLGAVVGISAALAGMMLPALFDSTTAADKLEQSLERLGDAVEIEDGVARLTNEIRELAKVSEQAAMAQLAQEIIDAKKVVTESAGVIRDAYDDMFGDIPISVITTQLDRYNAAMAEGGRSAEIAKAGISGLPTLETKDRFSALEQAVRTVSRQFNISRDGALEYLSALSLVAKNPAPESIQNLQNVVAKLNAETGFSNEKLISFGTSMSEAFSAARNAGEIMQVAEEFMKNFGKAIEDSSSIVMGFKSELDKLIGSIKFQADTIGMSDREIAKFVATQLAAKDETIDLNNAISEIDAYFDRIEAQEALTVKTKEQEQALKQARTAWESYAKSIETQSAKAESAEASNALMIQRIRETGAAAGKSAAEIQSLVDAQQRLFEQQQQQEADKAKQKVGSDVRFAGVTDQQAELTRLADSYMQQQLLLQTALEMELITRQEYADRKLLLEQQTQEQINQINQQGTASLKEQLDSVGFNLDTFQNQAIGAFAAVATGAMSGKDAIRGLAQSILTTAIGALIKMAITAAIGQKAATATGAATAAALGAAYATPAALASLASFGANAAPASAGIASTVALSQGLALGGGRLNGGPVYPGMMHPVAENGDPELLIQGNRRYLVPGSRGGEVVSNKDMMAMGGGSNVTVNVINNASGTKIEEKRSQGPDGAQMIEIIVADIQQRGKVHNAITNTTTAGNRI